MTATLENAFRVGVYKTAAQASRAVEALKAAGFTHDEIAVVCSDDRKEARFDDVQKPKADNDYPAEAIATGGVIGAAIGGVALAAATLATGGIAGAGAAVLMGGGAIAGAFTGAMSQRAFEKELGPYYEQAVRLGQVLVAVESQDSSRLAKAERILSEKGSETVALPEG